MASSRSPADDGLQLLEAALATGMALAALIVALGPVSGAHFNLVVTLADRMLNGTPARRTWLYLVAQVVAALLAVATVRVLWPTSVEPPGSGRPSGEQWQSWVGMRLASGGGQHEGRRIDPHWHVAAEQRRKDAMGQ